MDWRVQIQHNFKCCFILWKDTQMHVSPHKPSVMSKMKSCESRYKYGVFLYFFYPFKWNIEPTNNLHECLDTEFYFLTTLLCHIFPPIYRPIVLLFLKHLWLSFINSAVHLIQILFVWDTRVRTAFFIFFLFWFLLYWLLCLKVIATVKTKHPLKAKTIKNNNAFKVCKKLCSDSQISSLMWHKHCHFTAACLPWQQDLLVSHRPAHCRALGPGGWYPDYAGRPQRCRAALPRCGYAGSLVAWRASTDSSCPHHSTPSQATGPNSAVVRTPLPPCGPVSSWLCFEAFVELYNHMHLI